MKRFITSALFCFFLFYGGQAWATTLTSGSVASGSITSGGSANFTFTATTGQYVILTAGSTAFTPVFVVYKPSGGVLQGTTSRFRSNALPETGTYTVTVTGSGGGYGSFNVYYVMGGGAVSDGSLTSGQTASATLDKNGLKSYQFSGTSGAGIRIYAGESYGANIYVYKPDGTYWTYANDRFVGTLASTGTYTVVVSATSTSDSGDYDLYFNEGADSVSEGTMVSGGVYSATLPVNGLMSYQFEGTSGEGIRIYTGASYDANIIVYKPDGSYWTYATNRFSGTLPSTGTYTVMIAGFYYSDDGSYDMYYVKGNSTVSEGSLISGQARSGTLPANGLMSYTFSGTASTSLTISTTFGTTRYIQIYSPAGAQLVNSTSQPINYTLPASTGDYTIVFSGIYDTTTGAYTITATGTQPAITATTASKARLDTCPSTAAGNPINFDVGYKQQTETDYDAGGLTFSRVYRSDSTWTDNTVGDFWRHSYARTFTITGGTAASMTDGSGTTTTYTLSGSDWIPDDPSTTATLVTSGSDYLYTLADGTVEKYNSSKLLTRIAYQGGGALNLGYNGSSQLTSVTNENGRQLTMTYSSGRMATLVTPDGTFTYAYDGNDNLSTVTRPDTEVRTYHYENGTYVNALTGITDEKGVRFATYAYDGAGKAITTEYAGGANEYNVNYNSGNTSTVTNPLGKNTTYYYKNIQGVRRIVQVDGAASTNCVASNRYYNYDSLGRVIGQTDWENNTTRFEYDDRSNITKVTKAAGTASEQVKTITWDSTFNLPDLVTESGKTTNYDYDVYGRMTSMTVTDTATSATRVTAYTYYSNGTDGSGNTILGRLHEIDGPRTDVSDVTEFAYDGSLNLTTVENPVGHITEITARDSAGRPTTVEDANGVETDFVYDSNGRLDTVTRADGTALEAVTDFDYDENGNLTMVTLANGVTVEYAYDNAQRLTGIEDASGNTITYTLDLAGNITQEDIHASGPTLKYTHDQVFDELSRIIESVGASAQTADFAWDKNGNLTTYTDPETNATAYAYDPLQRLITSTNALSGVTELAYNGLDNVTSVEDQRNNSTTYTYNAFGDVTGETSPNRGTTSYTVDKAGNVTQRTDARSVVTNYTWDAIDRLLTVAYPSDSSLNATLTYDAASGCGTPYKGHLCSVSDAAGTTAYQYDVLGRVTQETDTRNSNALTTAYTYDLAGNILTITLPSGRVITYTRNANGLVSGVSAVVNGTSTTLASSITYLPFGPLNALTYGNSLTFSATFDQDYNPTNRTVSGSIYNNTYTTDDNGNITQAGTPTYGYDALNRVNAENPGSSISYTYDATDNRLTKVQGSTTTTTVPSTSNKISAVGANSYTYDAAGNITNDGTNTYAWNANGNLATVNTTGGVYTYNVANQRTKKVAGGTTTYYVYGAGGLLYGEYTSAGALVREYVYLNGAPLAQIDAGSPEVLTYLHADHLGTPRYGTNSGGTSVWAWTADAFGTSTPTGSATVNLRMPGQYADSESGNFYNWNRYYNPAIGRYISSDPIGLAGGLNTFNYADVSPVMYMDPEGLESSTMSSLGTCLTSCASELYNSPPADSAQAVCVAAATPLSKRMLGVPVLYGASKVTNPISYSGFLLKQGGMSVPSLPARVLGTTNPFFALGRANAYAAAGLLIYDASALTTCTATCAYSGGL